MLPCRRELNFNIFAVLAFSGAFWPNLERLGRLLGSTWRVLGASWALLRRSWGQLGSNLGALGVNQLGDYLSGFGAILGALGGSWARLGLLRICLGGPKRSQQLNLEAQSAPRRHLGGPKPV